MDAVTKHFDFFLEDPDFRERYVAELRRDVAFGVPSAIAELARIQAKYPETAAAQ